MKPELVKLLEETLQAQIIAEACGFDATAQALSEMRALLACDLNSGSVPVRQKNIFQVVP